MRITKKTLDALAHDLSIKTNHKYLVTSCNGYQISAVVDGGVNAGIYGLSSTHRISAREMYYFLCGLLEGIG